MFKRVLYLLMLVLLLSFPIVVFADGGHDNEDTAAEVDDHNEEVTTASSFALLPLLLGVVAGGGASGGAYASGKKQLSGLQLGVVGLTVATGVSHVVMGLGGEMLMLLNGLGYLALAAAIFLPFGLPDGLQRLLPIILAVYTLVTIAGYFVLHTPAQYSTLGLGSKAIEIVLVVLLGMMLSQRNAKA